MEYSKTKGEVRYMSLKKANPANAEKLYAENEANAKAKFEYLSKLGALYTFTKGGKWSIVKLFWV